MTTLDDVACSGIYLYIFGEYYNSSRKEKMWLSDICLQLEHASHVTSNPGKKSDGHKEALSRYLSYRLIRGDSHKKVQSIIDLFEDRLKLTITMGKSKFPIVIVS